MDDVYRQAITLQNKFRDWLDKADDGLARALASEIQRLTDEIEAQRNARTLEDRAKSIQRLLQQAEGKGVMDDRHLGELHDFCEEIRQDLRKLM